MEKISKLYKRIINKVKRILLNKKSPLYYANKGRFLLDNGKQAQAMNLLEKGLKFYPNSVLIHNEFGLYSMDKKKWEKAAYHFKYVIKSNKKKFKTSKTFLNYIQALKHLNKIDEAIKIAYDGLKINKNDEQLEWELIKLYQSTKRYEEAINVALKHYEKHSFSSKKYLLLSKLYIQQKLFEKADYVLREAIKKDFNNIVLIEEYAKVALYRFDWEHALLRYDYLSQLEGTDEPTKMNALIKKAMILQITGEHEKANLLYDYLYTNYGSLINSDTEGNRKIILFDNGESRIEYYKKLKKVDQLLITFDSLHMDWKEDPFGYTLLKKQDVDIIAIRKRRKSTYQQDLTQKEFIDTISKLIEDYKDIVAYGHSLGGYLALYFASNINCRILSLAPRISIHPIYGRDGKRDKEEFKHNITNNFNDKISPIIVYDPKDKTDSTYVHEELLKQFPNAKLIKMPYGGHGIARHLLRMGVLKDYILAVIRGEVPTYNRKLKWKSANYCRLLGSQCLRRNKINWAVQLSERAVELLPEDKYVVKFRVDVLKRIGKYEEAESFAKHAVKHSPKSLYLRLVLLDIYIDFQEFLKAERELKIAFKKFGERESLIKRKLLLENTLNNIINTPLEILEMRK